MTTSNEGTMMSAPDRLPDELPDGEPRSQAEFADPGELLVDEAVGEPGRGSRRSALVQGALLWRGLPAFALAVIAAVIVAVIAPDVFEIGPFTTFLATYAPIVLLGVGVAFPLLVGGIDMSVGPVMGLCAIFTVLLSSVGMKFWQLGPNSKAILCADPTICQQGLPFVVVVLAVIGIGAFIGLINGLVVALVRLQPLVATLATGFVAAGFGLYLFPLPGGQMPNGPVSGYSTASLLSWPLLVLVASVLLALLIMRSPLGVGMRAVGSNRWKAFASGMRVTPIVISAYVVSGAFAGGAGVLFTLNVASADPTVGVTFTLNAIAAAVLGGTALRGGWAEPFGPAIGALTLGFLAQLVSVLEVPLYYTQVVTGAMILIGLALTQASLRLTRKAS